jgi:hypothetical protein
MGYMTTITILNDAWDTIKRNPEQFLNNISSGMNGITYDRQYGQNRINSYPVGNHCNPMEVAESHHADNARLYLVYQNMMTTFGYPNDLKNIKLRKEFLKVAKQLIKDEEKKIREMEENK